MTLQYESIVRYDWFVILLKCSLELFFNLYFHKQYKLTIKYLL